MHIQLGIQDVVQNKRMEGEEEMEEGKIQGWETTFKSTQGTNCFSTISFPDWLPCNFIRTSYSERNIQETGLIHICPILSSDWVIKMPTNQMDSIYFSNKNEIITHVCRHTKTLESLEVILNVLSWFNFFAFYCYPNSNTRWKIRTLDGYVSNFRQNYNPSEDWYLLDENGSLTYFKIFIKLCALCQ